MTGALSCSPAYRGSYGTQRCPATRVPLGEPGTADLHHRGSTRWLAWASMGRWRHHDCV